MTQLIWSYVVNWVLGWGGVGTLVSAGLWAAWYFSPVFKTQLLHLAVGATIFTVASTYFYSRGIDVGYAACVRAVAAADEEALARVRSGQTDIRACRDGGGTWDVTSGHCR